MVFVRLAWAAFHRQKALYGLWLLSLSLAVTGLVIIDVYRESLSQMVSRQGRRILTADVTLSARRQISAEEHRDFINALPKDSRLTEVTEMTAMVSTAGESRLALLRFIDDDYPLFGDLQVNGATVGGRDLKTAQIWVAPDLLTLLPAQVGETLRIGEMTATIAGTVTTDSSQTFRFSGLAPRVYLHRRDLPSTHLMQFGSTFSDSWLALLNASTPGELRGFKALLEKKFRDPAIDVTVPADLEQGSLRVLTRLLDFLGLIGLVTLTLGWIGVYYLGRRWLALERSSAATLKCLGLDAMELQRLLQLKLGAVLICGVTLGGALSWLGAHAVFPLLKSSLPPEFQLFWSWPNTALLLLVGPLAGGMLMAEPIRQVALERPLSLLTGAQASPRLPWRATLRMLVLVLALFVVLTLLQARSWRVGGTFLAALSTCVVLVAASAWAALAGLRRLRARASAGGWRWHLASAQWLGRTGTTVLLVTVSALAGLLAQLIPHLERTLVGDLRAPSTNSRPALFLFDIQNEQLQPLQDFLRAQDIEISEASPLIRARIVRVNDHDFERAQTGTFSTREDEMDARTRNRGVNLSYRDGLSPSETVIAGTTPLGPGQISVEKNYADRMNLHLGDQLTFDIQGVEINAQVANLRSVNWDSFQPNFFIQFAPGVLDDAPKTWIMTVKRHSQLKPPQIQRLIAGKFSNVSSINVEETLDNLVDLISKLSSGLKIASRLALALGVFVFLMILLFQLLSSRQDWVQLQTQGLTPFEIWQLQVISFGTLVAVGTGVGSALAAGVNWALAYFAFGARSEFDVVSVSQIILWTWALSLLGLSWISWSQSRQIRKNLRAETL